MVDLIPIVELKRERPYKDLFSIKQTVKENITENMQEFGFDESKPIDVWRQRMIVIDGHTRLEAAIEAGMDRVYVFYHDFRNDGEALEYAIHNQRNRRNMTDSEFLRCVDAVDELKPTGRPSDTKLPQRCGSLKPTKEDSNVTRSNPQVENTTDHKKRAPTSAQNTSQIVGASPRKVEQARKVLKDPEKKEEVMAGEKTINRAYNEIREEEKAKPKSDSKFNKTTDSVEWSLWTWNPVTGCKRGCPYCYARDIANRFYDEGFEPTFRPERLSAPQNTKVPKGTDGNQRNVFVCSMADLFGEWVPRDWIDQVIETVRKNPQWNFLFLTKSPKRLVDIDWPVNAWVGTTVDIQDRVGPAKEAFGQIKATVKFLSCEPLREHLDFGDMAMFDWLIIGGQSKSSGEPAKQPEWSWVEDLVTAARKDGLMIYFKPNLESRPKEYPNRARSKL